MDQLINQFILFFFGEQILLESVASASGVRRRLQEAFAVRFEIGTVERPQTNVPGDRGAYRQHQKEFVVEDVAVQRVSTFILHLSLQH